MTSPAFLIFLCCGGSWRKHLLVIECGWARESAIRGSHDSIDDIRLSPMPPPKLGFELGIDIGETSVAPPIGKGHA
jgi:hypothetical protein